MIKINEFNLHIECNLDLFLQNKKNVRDRLSPARLKNNNIKTAANTNTSQFLIKYLYGENLLDIES